MEDQLIPILVVLAATAGAGFVQNSMGFGYALVAMAVMPLWIDIRVASLVVSFSSLVPLTLGAVAQRRQVSWLALRYSLIWMVLFLPLGLVLFTRVPAVWLVRGTGLVILLITLDALIVRRSEAPPSRGASRWWGGVAGSVSGFLVGFTGIGGPPLVAYAVRQPWSPTQFKGYIVPLLLVQAVLRAAGLLGTDLVDQTVLLYSAVAIPFSFLGGYLGTNLSRRINAQRFRQVALLMLAVIAVRMISSG